MTISQYSILVTYLLYVLEQCRVLLLTEDTVSERAGETLHARVHEVNEVQLQAQESVHGFLFPSLSGQDSLVGKKHKILNLGRNQCFILSF